ncbi:hypothetical protein AABD41_01600 [Staphylococcus pseudoxylosus]|uniref:hypothetical protein n=1 Tax=Staphylococcus pseudoxylosus TaxID=2282419 RepID=UPI00398A5980
MIIKTKKQLNLPQLIEYIWDNDLRHKWKDSDDTSAYVHVYDDGKISIDKCTVHSTFTIEVEEEITEDTELFLVERYVGGSGNIHYCRYSESSIKNAIESNPSDNKSTHFYIENDDRELILIWRDGKLVE